MLRKVLIRLERVIEFLWRSGRRIVRRGALRPVHPKLYAGYGRRDMARIRGRVLERADLIPPGVADTDWANFVRMARRWMTREVPGAVVELSFGTAAVSAVADREGYFQAEIAATAPMFEHGEGMLTARSRLAGAEGADPASVSDSGPIFFPGSKASFGVISDIDDTIIHTGATSLSQMLRVTLFGNAHTRIVFPHLPDFYRALRGGASGGDGNPFFYVTSSPWNLYDLLVEIFSLHEIPMGPLFMTDWGIDESKWLRDSHADHKLAAIRDVLGFYPNLPFILLGDSGQDDPGIYRAVVTEAPQRVRAVFIRDVGSHPPENEAALEALRASAAAAEVPFVLGAETLPFWSLAAAGGWVTAPPPRTGK